MKKTSKIWLIDKEEFIKLINDSKTKREFFEKINIDDNAGNYKTLDARIKEYNLDISHMKAFIENKKKNNNRIFQKTPLEEILVKNSPYKSVYSLKKRLLEVNLLKQECDICKIGTQWQGQYLSLQLDHKNGDRRDHRLKNLRLLCPNCHSQTETFAGKKLKEQKETVKCKDCGKAITKSSKSGMCVSCIALKRRKTKRPEKEELLNLILSYPFTKIGEIYSVSDNTIRDWCKFHNLPSSRKEINDYKRQKNSL